MDGRRRGGRVCDEAGRWCSAAVVCRRARGAGCGRIGKVTFWRARWRRGSSGGGEGALRGGRSGGGTERRQDKAGVAAHGMDGVDAGETGARRPGLGVRSGGSRRPVRGRVSIGGGHGGTGKGRCGVGGAVLEVGGVLEVGLRGIRSRRRRAREVTGHGRRRSGRCARGTGSGQGECWGGHGRTGKGGCGVGGVGFRSGRRGIRSGGRGIKSGGRGIRSGRTRVLEVETGGRPG
jgi:hypothetical protein